MKRRQHGGHTLAELLAVIAVVAVTAVVALPTAAPLAAFRADAGAGEIALALRFARDDAVRAGAYRVFGCEPLQNLVRVYGLEASGPNLVAVPVLQPDSRTPYILPLNTAPAGNNMPLASCSFVFADNTTATTVAFDAAGNPVRGTGGPAERAQPLRSGTVTLGSASVQRTVVLDVTGRITTP